MSVPRRLITRIALGLMLGALTTVAAAWAVANVAPMRLRSVTWSATKDPGGRMWMVREARWVGRESWMFWQHEPDMFLPREYDGIATRFHPPAWAPLPTDELKNMHDYTTTAFGLPAPCLIGTDGLGPSTYLCLGSRGAPRLPVVPICRGLAIDTASWAAAWAVLLTVPGLVRSRRRARRGRCVACGYDLVGIVGPCPECGAAAPIPRSAPA